MGAKVGRLTKRTEFLRAARHGRRWATPGLVLQAVKTAGQDQATIGGSAIETDRLPMRLGFTASRKVGGAVDRNRAKRRLRALAREVMPDNAAAGYDYVLIGRRSTVSRQFRLLRQDLGQALRKLRLSHN